MKKNMGMIDRVVRTVIAIAVGVLYYMNIIQGTLGIILLVLAVVFLLTSIISFCPLYLPLKLSTRKGS